MTDYKTEQEKFWAGSFGDEYIERNSAQSLIDEKMLYFSQVFKHAGGICSCCEFGTNIGLNLRAIKKIFPQIEMAGIEINTKAANECAKIPNVRIYNQSIMDFESDRQWELTFTSGVLIHIAPEMLPKVYEKLFQYSSKYIMISEYYELEPMEVEYRGNKGKLFKRDFAEELMELYPSLRLIDYGFHYHRDEIIKGEDVNWFLMQKS